MAKKKKSKWLDFSAFDDGYDFGDLTESLVKSAKKTSKTIKKNVESNTQKKVSKRNTRENKQKTGGTKKTTTKSSQKSASKNNRLKYQYGYEEKKADNEFLDYLSSSDVSKSLKTATGNLLKPNKEGLYTKGYLENGTNYTNIQKSLLSTGADSLLSLFEAGGTLTEKIVDTGADLLGKGAGALGAKGFQDKMEDFVEKDLIDEEKVATNFLENFHATKGLMTAAKIINGPEWREGSLLGNSSRGIIRSAGEVVALGPLGKVGTVGKVLPQAGIAVSAYGGSAEEAYKNGATGSEAGKYGLINAASAVLLGKLFKGVSIEGKALTEATQKKIASKITNTTLRTMANYGMDVTGEGVEEIAEEVVGNVAKKMTFENEKTWKELLASEEAMESYIIAGVGGSFTSGVLNTGRVSDSIKTGRDYDTGLTDIEQKVIDKEVDERINKQTADEIEKRRKAKLNEAIKNEIEKKSDKFSLTDEDISKIRKDVEGAMDYSDIDSTEIEVTKRERNKIADQVRKALERGEIDTGLITETFFEEGALRSKELAKERETATPERQAEIDAEMDALNVEFNKGLEKNALLKESYEQKRLKDEALDYKLGRNASDKAKKIVQSAIDSGADNTRKTHERIDFLIKMAEDSDVDIAFTSDAELEQLGFYQDVEDLQKQLREAQNEAERDEIRQSIEDIRSQRGYSINGLADQGKRKLLLNVDSKKVMEVTSGHEITHFAEEMGSYDNLKSVLKEFAESKGEYKRRMDEAYVLYFKEIKGMSAEDQQAYIEQEVTADLVGEYIFNDQEFIDNLSVKDPNIFMKAYDYVNHIYKMATAGSEEERKLEQAKRMFEKTYKQMNKSVTQGSESNSLTDADSNKYSRGYHAGDLGKSEHYGMQGYDRGTGHFGTGTYFVGEKSKIEGYNTRNGKPAPVEEVEFDNYNLYRPSEEKAGILHEALKVLDGGIEEEWINKADGLDFRAIDPMEKYEIAEQMFGEDNYKVVSRVKALQEVAKRHNIEYTPIEEYKEEFEPHEDSWYDGLTAEKKAELIEEELYDEYYEVISEEIEAHIEKVNERYGRFRDAYDKLCYMFGFSKTKAAVEEVAKRKIPESYKAQATLDSNATVFMKALGYEGIDVRGTRYDNTAYGSVIYDLKGKDLERKQEIGTARFSKSDNDYMSAVEKGDTETAQRLVDEAAKNAGYTQKRFHETKEENIIHVFDLSLNTNASADYQTPFGVFTKGHDRSVGLGGKQMKLFVKAERTFRLKDRSEIAGNLPKEYSALVDKIKQIDEKYEPLYEETSDDWLYAFSDWLDENDPNDVIRNKWDVTKGIEEQFGDILPEDIIEMEREYARIRDEWTAKTNEAILEAKTWLTKWLKDNNYDSMELEFDNGAGNRVTDALIVLDSNQVKSADAITYDDNGNVIPLSERFNEKKEDIRFSKSDNNGSTRLADGQHPDIRFSRSTELIPMAKPNSGYGKTYLKARKGLRTVRDVRDEAMLKNGYTQEDVDKVNTFMDEMADFMDEMGTTYQYIGLQDVNDAKIRVRRNAKGEPVSIIMSAMVRNGDYPVNFDFSSICKKRQAMMKVIEEISSREGHRGKKKETINLTAENLWKINEKLREEGLETACLGCFVEAKRYNVQAFADKAVKMWNDIVDEVRGDKNAPYFDFAQGVNTDEIDYGAVDKAFKGYVKEKGRTSPEARMRALIKNGGETYQRYLQPFDIMTPAGIEAIKAMSTDKNNFYGILQGVYGQAAPKEVMAFSPYNSEIALLPPYKGTGKNKKALHKYIKEIGGVRMQSFSDFLVQNVYDYMQMVGDLAARRLPAHAYTKEISFAKIFGMTGIKTNLSLMFDIDPNVPDEYAGLQFVEDANGNEVYEGKRGNWEYIVADAKRSEAVYQETGHRPYVQSIGWDDAIALQNDPRYSANVGTIGVGYSDNHILKMLGDKNITYIIPYHSSSLPAFIKGVTNIRKATDYTDPQNTRVFKSLKQIGKNIHYDMKAKFKELGSWGAVFEDIMANVGQGAELTATSRKDLAGTGDFPLYERLEATQDPKATANEYLEWCGENGYMPVFPQFAGHENYYKFLFDFKVYDSVTGEYAPQKDVQNIYPDDVKAIIDAEMAVQNKANMDRDAKIPSIVDDVLRSIGEEQDVKLSMSSNDIAPVKENESVFKYSKSEDIAPVGRALTEADANKRDNSSNEFWESLFKQAETTPLGYDRGPLSEKSLADYEKQRDEAFSHLVGEEYISPEDFGEREKYVSERARELYKELSGLKKGVKASAELGYLLDVSPSFKSLKASLYNLSRNPRSDEGFVKEALHRAYETKLEDSYYDDMEFEEIEKTERKTRIKAFMDVSQERVNKKEPIEINEPIHKEVSPNKPKKHGLGTAWDTIQSHWVNRNRQQDKLAKQANRPEIKFKGDRVNNISAEIGGDIFKAQTDNYGNAIGKSLHSYFEPILEAGNGAYFNDYLFHLSNIERHAQGVGSQTPAETSMEYVKAYEDRFPEFKKPAEGVHQYGRNGLYNLVENGVYSKEFADGLTEKYKHYVPFFAVEIEAPTIDMSPDEIRSGRPIKRARGGAGTTLQSVEQAMIKQTYAYMNAVATNDLFKEIVNAYGGGGSKTIDTREGDTVKLEDFLYEDETGKYLTAFFDGEAKSVQIPEELFKELKGDLDTQIKDIEEKLGIITKRLQKVSQLRGKLLTTYNPGFVFTNPFKDVQDALLNSKYTGRYIANIPSAFTDSRKGGKVEENAKKFKAHTGQDITTVTDPYTLDAKAFALYSDWRDGSMWNRFMTMYGNTATQMEYSDNTEVNLEKSAKRAKNEGFLNKLSNANNFMEVAFRYPEFKATLEKGKSVTEALYNAREVTTNFGRGGTISKAINRNGATFFNTSVQGMDKFFRNFSMENGAKGFMKAVAKSVIFGMTPAMINHILLGGGYDDEYEALPEYVKSNYYLFRKGDGEFYRIPKGRMISVLGSAARLNLEASMGKVDPTIAKEVDNIEFLKNAKSQIGASNPLKENVFAPLIQAYNNEAWYGGDLVPSRLQKLPAAEQYDATTDEFSKWLGDKLGTKVNDVLPEKLQVNPYKINYVLDQYSGGIGDMLLPYITPEASSGAEGVGMALAPIADKFVVNSTDDNRYTGELYDLSSELEVRKNSSEATLEDVLNYDYINDVAKQMNELYKLKREVQADKTLSKSQKYEEVHKVQELINDLASEGVKNYNSGASIDIAYETNPDAVISKVYGGDYDDYKRYKSHKSFIWDLRADKDENGNSISGSKKEKVINYLNDSNLDDGEWIILFKQQYPKDDTYNEELIDYLNSRDDLYYEDVVLILESLGMKVSADGTVEW